ncbi:Uncharacterised protein [Mycobacteroides abscessus subsp. abscessus]|nr:Uncharacterised protein [Mycobacteroides abscessus subsp. abscessus]
MVVGMTAAFDDMDLRDLVDLLTDEEKRELRPAVLRVLHRLPDQEVLRRDLSRRLLEV